MDFRERLRDEMDYQCISAKDLSESTGISKRTIDNYLKTNPQEPGVVNALKISKALKVSVEYLVTGENINSSQQNTLSSETKTIIEKIKQLSTSEKKVIIDMIKVISNKTL